MGSSHVICKYGRRSSVAYPFGRSRFRLSSVALVMYKPFAMAYFPVNHALNVLVMSMLVVLFPMDTVSEVSDVEGSVLYVTPVSVQLPAQGRTTNVYVLLLDA